MDTVQVVLVRGSIICHSNACVDHPMTHLITTSTVRTVALSLLSFASAAQAGHKCRGWNRKTTRKRKHCERHESRRKKPSSSMIVCYILQIGFDCCKQEGTYRLQCLLLSMKAGTSIDFVGCDPHTSVTGRMFSVFSRAGTVHLRTIVMNKA